MTFVEELAKGGRLKCFVLFFICYCLSSFLTFLTIMHVSCKVNSQCFEPRKEPQTTFFEEKQQIISQPVTLQEAVTTPIITERQQEPFSYPFYVDFTRYKKPKRRGREGRGEPGSDSYYVIPHQQNATVTFNKTAYTSRTCSAITGRRILMNYAHNCCKRSQPLNCETGLENGFDICIQYNQDSIDDFFLESNQKLFDNWLLAGFGIWKSYLVMRLLMTLDDDDVLFYSDSGAEFIDSPEDYFCLMDERNQDVVVFSVGLPENQFSKGDALLLGGCTTFECAFSEQRLGGYSIYRKSMAAFNFLSVWLAFNQDLRLVSLDQSQMANDLPGFRINRFDQTALSLASKRCGIPEWPDPSQYGADGYNKQLREKPEFKKIAKTIINCTRYKE